MNVLELIGRTQTLFDADLARHEAELGERVRAGRFLVIGGAGSIGQAVCREIFRRRPRLLHVVDISENNLVELVRDLRSSLGYIDGEFATFALDVDSVEFRALMAASGGYDHVLNLSALKHVRSEKDPYTLMRMLQVNVFNTLRSLEWAQRFAADKYFCVSTDKAAAPVNMMGASKRIMELFLMQASHRQVISTARFANVAFSDGSLLHGFNQRLLKQQPIAAPQDVRRYFVTGQESGQLCLMSCLLGGNRDIFFPKLSQHLHLVTFAEIAARYLRARGYEPHPCGSEDEARQRVAELSARGRWPCWFFDSDTTGEKDFEEFHTGDEALDLARFESVGIVRSGLVAEPERLQQFQDGIGRLRQAGRWDKADLLALFRLLLPDFAHKETGKYLDGRM